MISRGTREEETTGEASEFDGIDCHFCKALVRPRLMPEIRYKCPLYLPDDGCVVRPEQRQGAYQRIFCTTVGEWVRFLELPEHLSRANILQK